VATEVGLFWAALAALWFIDNLVLLPPGGDFLSFGRRGVLRYKPGARLQVRHRDLVLLNPLNPFDRLVATTRSLGPARGLGARAALRQVRGPLRAANGLSWIGSGYLAIVAACGVASVGQVYFGHVLIALATAHVACWLTAACVLVARRSQLQLGPWRVFSLAAEALFVPGYLVNLGKRVWFRQTWDLPALAFGLSRLKQLRADPAHELHGVLLMRRLDELDSGLAPSGDEAARTWIAQARQCLKTSAPAAGS
jgi:hypothetical protein